MNGLEGDFAYMMVRQGNLPENAWEFAFRSSLVFRDHGFQLSRDCCKLMQDIGSIVDKWLTETFVNTVNSFSGVSGAQALDPSTHWFGSLRQALKGEFVD